MKPIKGNLQNLVSHHILLIRVTCLLEHLLGVESIRVLVLLVRVFISLGFIRVELSKTEQVTNLKCRQASHANQKWSLVSFVKFIFSTEITMSNFSSKYSFQVTYIG